MRAHIPILVVDDNPDITELMAHAAKSVFPQAQFIKVLSFSQAASYLEGLEGPGPRLVLLDINLQSEQSGLDFLRLLRQHPQGQLVPVIILSADQGQKDEAYLSGANAFYPEARQLRGLEVLSLATKKLLV